ncbi:MAG: dihydroorotate dehydrogenase electron transfer subunit [bacterium]|nr:dihydroorotate dehydrogenase electron transfer subunit [bacterium]
MIGTPISPVSAVGRVTANRYVSSAFLRLDIDLGLPFDFRPGQFAMVNEPGPGGWTFSRPFSVLAAADQTLSLLYRVVGRGTAALAELPAGASLQVLGPLGTPFPAPTAERSAVLLGGGVGLPPVLAWCERWGRKDDIACFGARDGAEVPWELLGPRWHVSVDRPNGLPPGRVAFTGVVTGLARTLPGLPGPGRADILACGPLPLLRAAARLAQERGWGCYLSLEEHMGCGYGVCKGCVVPVVRGGSVRNATCCQEGPVFAAADLPWLGEEDGGRGEDTH